MLSMPEAKDAFPPHIGGEKLKNTSMEKSQNDAKIRIIKCFLHVCVSIIRYYADIRQNSSPFTKNQLSAVLMSRDI